MNQDIKAIRAFAVAKIEMAKKAIRKIGPIDVEGQQEVYEMTKMCFEDIVSFIDELTKGGDQK